MNTFQFVVLVSFPLTLPTCKTQHRRDFLLEHPQRRKRTSIAANGGGYLLLRHTAVGRFYKVKPFVEKNSR
ncbi:MAG: hypothetical protein KDC06_08785 [Chitinophagaceae bacterium]|nr:hypothetical protein [Chitinophagaceae bacterium]